MQEDRALFCAIANELTLCRNLVLVTVLKSSGSTPRGPGAKLLVKMDGTTLGTVGGGAIEHEAYKLALKTHESQASFFKEYVLAPNEAADIGMVCGGSTTLYFQFISGANSEALRLAQRICELIEKVQGVWLITRIKENSEWEMAVYSIKYGLEPSVFLNSDTLKPMLKQSAVLVSGENTYFAQPLTQPGCVYIFGGGHVSQALVPVLAQIGFYVVVLEDRKEFLNPALFAGAAEVLECDFLNLDKTVELCEPDYIVIMTRGHKADAEVLIQALRSNASYIGMIGSRTKVKSTRALVLKAGLKEKDFLRVHSPIGLEIGAQTPAEIAISIAAELIAHRAKLRLEP